MGVKLFQDDGTDADTDDISKIEIDEKFAHRYEHNKKREDLQRYEEYKKRGLIEDSESETESSDDEDDIININSPTRKKDIEFFDNLNKVKNRDPSIYKNNKLFESESDSDSDDDGKEEDRSGNDEENVEGNKKKKKPLYLKDVVAQHLMEEGPEFNETEPSKSEKKTYKEEQEELKKAFLDAVKNAEQDSEDDFLKVKESREENEDNGDGGEFEKKLGEYFDQEEELDENKMFLKEFFMNRMWVDKGTKDKKSVVGDDELDEVLIDEEEIEKQERYEENYNFRYEENTGDRVMGHSRKVEGSVRKKENTRTEQRKSKEERIKVAELRKKEELKHLKNLKKKEIETRLREVMKAAGIKDDDDCPLDLDDLEEDFDPGEYDKMMKAAFNEKYYETEDLDPEFGSDGDEDGEIGKPDFDKEDELLGLPKGWDVLNSGDGFLAARERNLKLKVQNSDDDNHNEGGGEEEEGNGLERSDESKRKRKRKMSLVKKAKMEMMEEYYKLDYEDTIGDLKTRFKYAKVKPNRYGLKTKEILMMDDMELNQYVSIKKLAPYKEKEWKVPNSKRHQIKELLQEKLHERKTGKKNRLNHGSEKSTLVLASSQDGKAELEVSNVDMPNLSKQAKRRRRHADLKLSDSRLKAYGKMQTKAKGKGKH